MNIWLNEICWQSSIRLTVTSFLCCSNLQVEHTIVDFSNPMTHTNLYMQATEKKLFFKKKVIKRDDLYKCSPFMQIVVT